MLPRYSTMGSDFSCNISMTCKSTGDTAVLHQAIDTMCICTLKEIIMKPTFLKNSLLKLIHWDRDKMVAIWQTTFSNAFSCMKGLDFFIKVSLKYVPKGPISNKSTFFSDNGLAPTRRHAIIWITYGLSYWRICASLGLNGLRLLVHFHI